MRMRIFTLTMLSLSGALAGCSGDDTNGAAPDAGGGDASHVDPSSGTDNGGGGDSSASDSGGGGDSSASDSGAGDAADGEAGPAAINGCRPNDFVDQTDGGTPTITFPTTAAPAQYTPPCVKIKAGQSVMWSGAFANHPLNPTAGVGSANNPITATSSGTSVTFAFPNAGTFAFNCGFHPTTMLGVIEVVP
jgi:plastocyanin